MTKTLTTCGYGIFLCLFFFLAVPSGFANPVILQELTGTAKISKQSSGQWVDAAEGMELNAGDRIMTDAKSAVVLVFSKGRVELDENTDFAIMDWAEKEEQLSSKMTLKLGALKAKIDKMKSGSEFQITTPTSIASVRGTFLGLWVFTYLGEIFTRLDVYEGLVGFSNLDGSGQMDVGQGQHATGGDGGSTGPQDDGNGQGGDSGDDGGDSSGGSSGVEDSTFGNFFDAQGGFQQQTPGSQDSSSGGAASDVPSESSSGSSGGDDDSYSMEG